jgi:hypothetical protein
MEHCRGKRVGKGVAESERGAGAAPEKADRQRASGEGAAAELMWRRPVVVREKRGGEISCDARSGPRQEPYRLDLCRAFSVCHVCAHGKGSAVCQSTAKEVCRAAVKSTVRKYTAKG